MAQIAVLGAGSWGTALALLLGRNGHAVRLWGRDREAMALMARVRRNPRYLPDTPFPPSLTPIADLDSALDSVDWILAAIPTRALVALLTDQPTRFRGSPLVLATKGLEPGSGRLLHEVVSDRLGEQQPLAVISGPSFAREVAQGQPTAVTVAARDPALATTVAAALHCDRFRAYTSADLIGVELGGAVKNVVAIAAGIGDGLGFGANARAALITRGLAELIRLGGALGAAPQTLTGLSGMGDLVLTCTDNQSRNRRLGLALARGAGVETALTEIGQAVEGVETARVIDRAAARAKVEMPICHQVYRVLFEGLEPLQAVGELMARDPKPEQPLALDRDR